MRLKLKAFAGLAICLTYAVIGAVVHLIVWREGPRRKILSKLISLTSRILLKMMNLKVNILGQVDRSKAYFVVANHLSYIDVMVIAAYYPCIFVTSTDAKESIIEGPLSSMGGCLFVNRQNRDNIGEEIKDIGRVMKLGINVLVFPEATTSNGEALLRFRKPLYTAAFDTGLDILPLCINYRKIDSEPIHTENRSSIYFFDPIPIGKHITRVLKLKSIEADLHFLKPLPIKNLKDVTEAAKRSQEEINKVFKPVASRQDTPVLVRHSSADHQPSPTSSSFPFQADRLAEKP